MKAFTIRITCKDQKGLVYKISDILYKNELNIIKNDEFVDNERAMFFMRTEVVGLASGNHIASEIEKILAADAKIEWCENKPKNVVIFVTKEHHCIADLLIRNRFKDLFFNIVSVVGNYEKLAPLVTQFGVPFTYISTDGIDRETQETKVKTYLDTLHFDYIVLAKYMRILSPQLVKQYLGKIINIHHSFLPAFIGAKPYLQAFNRGVKIIGATAHFVTNDLDEGPIIFQDVVRVSHSKTVKELSKLGKDVEKIVLANALKLVFEDKVFIDGNKTIIFE